MPAVSSSRPASGRRGPPPSAPGRPGWAPPALASSSHDRRSEVSAIPGSRRRAGRFAVRMRRFLGRPRCPPSANRSSFISPPTSLTPPAASITSTRAGSEGWALQAAVRFSRTRTRPIAAAAASISLGKAVQGQARLRFPPVPAGLDVALLRGCGLALQPPQLSFAVEGLGGGQPVHVEITFAAKRRGACGLFPAPPGHSPRSCMISAPGAQGTVPVSGTKSG